MWGLRPSILCSCCNLWWYKYEWYGDDASGRCDGDDRGCCDDPPGGLANLKESISGTTIKKLTGTKFSEDKFLKKFSYSTSVSVFFELTERNVSRDFFSNNVQSFSSSSSFCRMFLCDAKVRS